MPGPNGSGATPSPGDDGFRVLLVEDEPGDRWLLAEVLRSRGHSVIACEDAESGWEAWDTHAPPLVLLDLMLPGIDGLDLCRRIRAHERGTETVVLVVTGKDDPGTFQEVLEAGADDYMTKPADVDLLNVRLAIAERQVREQLERAHTARELAVTSRELETLFRNLDEVFFSIDVENSRLIQVSPAVTDLLGHTPAELMGDDALWRSLLLPDELRGAGSSLDDVRPDRPRVFRYPVEVEGVEGGERWVEASLKAEVDDGGRVTRIDGVLSDVTERHRSRKELAARNKELMTLYRISEVTLTARSPEQAWEETLEELCRGTGFPIAAIERHDPERETLVVVACRGMPEAETREIPARESLSGVAVRTGRPVVEADVRARASEHSAEVFHRLGIRAYLSFPMVVGQEVVGTLTLAHTESVQPEPRLVRWVGSVANTVASYVERLSAEEALKENERRYRLLATELQQANRELEAFAYSVSHDLRAPLRTMQGFAHALLQNFGDSLDPEARDYAERIIASGRQSEELIKDLLAYSRLSFEEVELQPVELDQVVKAALEQVDADLREADAEVEVESPLPAVMASHTTLVQVVTNLLSNAVKFVPPERTPRVRIAAEEDEEHTRLWVVDNGVGVPEGQEERIFRVFERLSDGGDTPGTGIGLAVVRRGMERIGGEAGVAPAPDGPGSAFWVQLPRMKEKRVWRPWKRRERP